ncbi:Rv3235 family protein [Streptomyces thioluteus]|uniref:Rv3235 family protein n=1 Tax=Streptomyces thioluteus TaxID=66431 RepID=UPI0031E852AE
MTSTDRAETALIGELPGAARGPCPAGRRAGRRSPTEGGDDIEQDHRAGPEREPPGRTITADRLPPSGRRPGGRARQARARIPRYWFAEQLLLTLSGQRPVHRMIGHTLPAAYDLLAELAPRAPLRPAAPGGRTPLVHRCDEFQPRPGVIEAYARIVSGDRLEALAFRLEQGTDRRWRCSAVELGCARA